MVQDAEVEERVAILSNLRLEDDQPCVDGSPTSMSLVCDPELHINFQDRCAFDTPWIAETVAMEKLEDILRTGERFINEVYTFRGCSKALPQVKTAEQENRQQIYEKSFEVLEPEIKRLREFMYFQRDTIKVFCDNIKRLSAMMKDKKRVEEFVVSESMIMYFIRLLDLFALLDALKNMKASLNNDFSFYKRSLQFMRKPSDETTENNTLYLFLANSGSITTNLKTELQQIDSFDDILAMVVHQCADSLDAGRYLLPSEKHCLLRVMPYALFLMDGEKNNIFKKKDFPLVKFSRIFKRNPVVSLFGDMQITLESLIKRSPHFDEKVWGVATDDVKLNQEYELLHVLSATRTASNDYTSKFANMINDIKISQKYAPNTLPSPTECREIVTVVLQGLQLLSDWSSKVLQQSAWKYARPNNDPAITSSVDYERVVKYNYTSEERFALVEFIAMIKGLAGLLIRYEPFLTPIIKRAVHDELQEFVQITLREMIRSISKKKKANIRGELLQLRSIAADWISGSEPVADPALYGKKSNSKEDDKIQLPLRSVGPSATQLDLIRSIVYGLIYRKKEFTSSQVRELEDFYSRSFFYKYVLSIVPTVQATTDLADLWYREFYLELSKRLQFPIEMSLPWILTDHILESRDAAMMESVLYPLDIYNDAAQRALTKLGTRFLYDEIEAEVNLCFDQLLFKLSDEIFQWFKIQASTILLDKPYKAQLEIVYSNVNRFNVPKSRYDVIMRQRHFQLLGRSLDLNKLISQRQNNYLRQNIEYAISRFEASDLTAILELEHQLTNIQLVHKMMSEYLALDPWDKLLNEVNESTSLLSYHGRIVLHVIFELMYDFFPNFNYNDITQRFVRTPFSFTAEVQRDPMPKSNQTFMYGNRPLSLAYMGSADLAKKFFGLPHFRALLRLVGGTGLPLMVGEILRNMELKVVNVLAPYVKELLEAMPATKLPIHDYGTEGGYGYFQLKLKEIFTYPDLRPEVLHNFRIFGNAVVFMNLLSVYSSEAQVFTFLQAAPFLGFTPSDMSPNENESPLFANIQKVAKFLETKPELTKCPPVLQEIVLNAWRADRFYRPLVPSPSLFKSILQRIDALLEGVRLEWSGGPPDNGVMNIDNTNEFYRMWSALQFVICFPTTSENDASCHELFGDGLMWAGSTIIYFLGQQRRFEAFDFSYHILKLEDAATTPCQKPNMKQFFRSVMITRDLNQSIFALLNIYAPFAPPPLSYLHPPSMENIDAQVFVNIPEERGVPATTTMMHNGTPPHASNHSFMSGGTLRSNYTSDETIYDEM